VSALSRCSEWLDVELKASKPLPLIFSLFSSLLSQISLAIAIMVANETDWHLLVKGSELHLLVILILLSLSLFAADVHSLLSTLQGLLTRASELQTILGPQNLEEKIDYQSLNIRKLVATAISRLCLVLCAEWGKPSSGTFTDFGTFLISADVEQLPSSALEFHRKLLGTRETSRKRDRALNSSDSEANLSKMLKTVMTIIKILSPIPVGGSSVSKDMNLPGSPRASSAQSATRRRSSSTSTNTVPFLSMESLSDANGTPNLILTSPIPASFQRSDLFTSGTIHRSLSEASGINNQDKVPSLGVSRPSSLQVMSISTDTSETITQGVETDCEEIEPIVDEALVPCSVALSNLLQIEDCRAMLVKDGALSLLACWLDVAANVLQWHNSARLQASTPTAHDETIGMSLSDFTSTSSHSSPSAHGVSNRKMHQIHQQPQTQPENILRSSSVGSGSESCPGVVGILLSGHPVYELINNVSGSVMSLTTNSTSSPSETRRGRNPNSNYNAGRIDAMVMGEGLPSAICRFLLASTYDYTLSNLPSWKTLQLSILPRGGAIALSQAMCAMAQRSQNRESMLEAGAPQSIIRLLVDAIFRRKKIDHGLDDEMPKYHPSEEYGPRKLEKLYRQQCAETSYLSTLAENCLQMLSHFVSDSIATIPVTQKMNHPTSVLPTAHEWSPTATSTSTLSSLPLVISLLIHPRVVDAIKYITNQPRGTCRLAAVRIISMLVEWPEALDMLHSHRISDVLVRTSPSVFSSSNSRHLSCLTDGHRD
jgi:hypothetical protein